MSKIAFVFSGQGAQYPGMLEEVYNTSSAAKKVFEEAEKQLDRSIMNLCFHGTQEDLNLTHNTQPCVLAADLAAAKALVEQGITPDGVAGFSLGEYAALTLSGVINEEDIFRIVQIRADAMQDAVPAGEGAMAAIIGPSGEEVEALCRMVTSEYVAPSNYNSPVQTVIAGTAAGVKAAVDLAQKQGYTAVVLQVSVPSHCKLMKPATEKIEEALDTAELHNPSIPIYMNCTGDQMDAAQKKSQIVKQLYSPLLWTRTIMKMYEDGYDIFIECGPGKTLSGLIKKILKGKDILICRTENSTLLTETVSQVKRRVERGI